MLKWILGVVTAIALGVSAWAWDNVTSDVAKLKVQMQEHRESEAVTETQRKALLEKIVNIDERTEKMADKIDSLKDLIIKMKTK